MPAPSKTSDAEIIAAAIALLERRGPELSMTELAGAVGIRTPSLYGRFADRATLLTAVERVQWQTLERRMRAEATDRDPLTVLTRQARAYRAFAKANPAAYALMFRLDADRAPAGTAARAAAVAPSLPAFAALVGPDDALTAARVLTPFLHGFVSMEIAGAFRLGGGLDTAFEQGVATILRGLQHSARPTRRTRTPRTARRPPARRKK
jgi:AcrR family transcriptional regulator